MDQDLELAERIHAIVSILTAYSSKFDSMIKSNENAFVFPKKAVVALKDIVDTNAYLVSKLFEENQTLYDGIEKSIQKAKNEKET